MARQRNLLPLGGLLLCGIAFLSYPLFFAGFPATRDVPWVNWLLFALGLGLVGVGTARAFWQPERYRGRIMGPVFGVLSLAVVGAFLFMTVSYARQLPESAGAPKVGEKAPDFTLLDSQGKPVSLSGVSRSSWV